MAVDHSSPKAQSSGKVPGSAIRASAVTWSLTLLQSSQNTSLGRLSCVLPIEALREADPHLWHAAN